MIYIHDQIAEYSEGWTEKMSTPRSYFNLEGAFQYRGLEGRLQHKAGSRWASFASCVLWPTKRPRTRRQVCPHVRIALILMTVAMMLDMDDPAFLHAHGEGGKITSLPRWVV